MAAAYKLLSGGAVVLRLADHTSFLAAPGSEEYQRYLADVANGAEVLPADPPTVVYSGRLQIDARVRTTNASATEIYRGTLAQNTLYRGRLELLGVDAGNGTARYIEARVVVKRLGNGAVLVGTPDVVSTIADAVAASWAVAASVSGNDFVVTVAGAAGRTIDWQLAGDVVRFAPGGVE